MRFCISMLGRENVEDGNGLAAEILDRRRKRASTRKQLALAFCEAAPPNGADLAPQNGTIGYRAVLKCSEVCAIEVGFDLVVVHAGEQHLARSAGVKRRWHAEIRHAAHGVQSLDEIDVYA